MYSLKKNLFTYIILHCFPKLFNFCLKYYFIINYFENIGMNRFKRVIL